LEKHADGRAGDRPDDQQEWDLPLAVEQAAYQADPGGEKVEQHREKRPQVQRDVEGQAEAQRVEVERALREDEVRGRADRQELGEPLDEAEERGGERVVHARILARAARRLSCAEASCASAPSSRLAQARRCPGSRNRIATVPSNGPVPPFSAA